ncbi:MAG: GNAT family N-acetyltransferase [Rhodospirillaceae bacterium]
MFGFRKLYSGDAEKFAEHIIRLDNDDRRCRFAASLSDNEIRGYCKRIDWPSTTVIGYFDERSIRGAVELRREPGSAHAEVAFSVERVCQGQGVGTTLMRRIVLVAQNTGITRLSVICQPQNRRMRQMLTRFNAESTVDIEEVVSSIQVRPPSPLSLVQETLDDGAGLMPILFGRWYSDVIGLMTPYRNAA